ncbi:hypothetical protein Fmac_029321 [Flemingia macrophylla]|uniref:Uncharacterized protein n=1 Tax=Flemingia macrophylla TaxID=520843 RepID=A0ABD1L9Z6_9FABA
MKFSSVVIYGKRYYLSLFLVISSQNAMFSKLSHRSCKEFFTIFTVSPFVACGPISPLPHHVLLDTWTVVSLSSRIVISSMGVYRIFKMERKRGKKTRVSREEAFTSGNNGEVINATPVVIDLTEECDNMAGTPLHASSIE